MSASTISPPCHTRLLAGFYDPGAGSTCTPIWVGQGSRLQCVALEDGGWRMEEEGRGMNHGSTDRQDHIRLAAPAPSLLRMRMSRGSRIRDSWTGRVAPSNSRGVPVHLVGSRIPGVDHGRTCTLEPFTFSSSFWVIRERSTPHAAGPMRGALVGATAVGSRPWKVERGPSGWMLDGRGPSGRRDLDAVSAPDRISAVHTHAQRSFPASFGVVVSSSSSLLHDGMKGERLEDVGMAGNAIWPSGPRAHPRPRPRFRQEQDVCMNRLRCRRPWIAT